MQQNKLKPILFSTPMVQAILEGRKTMTRRIIKMKDGSLMQDEDLSKHLDGSFDCVMDFTKTFPYWKELECPYGQVGDVLWVRETWQHWYNDIMEPTGHFFYKADNDKRNGAGWKPSIFMPKSACRIFLKITDVKVERLQDISEKDAMEEGVERCIADKEKFGCRAMGMRLYRDYERKDNSLKNYPCNGFDNAKSSFQTLWQSINGAESWDENPFVWVISYKRLERAEFPI